jgi:protein involved in polysaccharide export with SLBB domain
MAGAFVQSDVDATTAGDLSLTLTGVGSGNMLIVALSWGHQSTDTSVETDNGGPGFTQAASAEGSNWDRTAIWYLENVNSGTHNVTVDYTGGSHYARGVLLEYSGLATSSALDGNNGGTNGGTPNTVGSGNITTSADCLFIANGTQDGGDADMTHSLTGATEDYENQDTTYMPVSVASSPTLDGTYSNTFTRVGGGDHYMSTVLAAFLEASGGVAPTPAVEDAVTVNDTPTMLAYQPIYLVAPGDELVTVADLPTLSLSELFLTAAVEDAITVGDTPTMLAYQPTYLVAPGDELITVNDLPTLSLSELFLTASDDVTVAEDVTVRLPFLVPSVQDDLTVGEDVTALLPFLVPAVQDDVTVGEVVDAFVFHLHIDVSDGVTVDDTNLDVSAGEVPAKPVASDAVTVNEVVGLSLSELFLSVEDAVTVGDTPTMLITESLNASVEDGVTVGEDVTAFIFPLFASAQDDITVGEDIDALITKLQVVANESITVGEDVTMRVPFLALDESESVTVGESVSASRFGGTLLIDSLGAEAVTVGESVRVSTGGGSGDDTAAIRQRFRIVGERRYGNKRAIKP